MDIPPHISAFGSAKETGYLENITSPSTVVSTTAFVSDMPTLSAKMNVPERIIFAGSNRLMEGQQQATDVFSDDLVTPALKQALNAPPTTLTVNHIFDAEVDDYNKGDENEHTRANSLSQSSNYFGDEEVIDLRKQLGVLTDRINKMEQLVSRTRKFNILSFSASAIALIFSVLLFLKRNTM
uniref:Mitochondrial fission factor n=1 Tax=Syphacia muris TaxID=451379 RepID=A0A0N5AHU4_9BILA